MTLINDIVNNVVNETNKTNSIGFCSHTTITYVYYLCPFCDKKYVYKKNCIKHIKKEVE